MFAKNLVKVYPKCVPKNKSVHTDHRKTAINVVEAVKSNKDLNMNIACAFLRHDFCFKFYLSVVDP